MSPNLSPLPRYSGANYPTKEQILLHPELLKTVPRRWARNPVVLTALSLVLSAGLTACGKEQSLEELREQVRDFLQWLKAQGVI